MNTRWMDSPLGGLRLWASAGVLLAIEFDAQARGSRQSHPVLDETQQQLADYFAGARTEFDLPITCAGTEFQQKVWSQLRCIRYGQTATYGQVASRLGYAPSTARAVGAAIGANPIPVVVPCHRVVGGDGSLTGYAGGLERKRILLELEQPGLF